MSIKRYVANADNSITNAFKSNLRTRATGSNMGASDVLEVFHIYGQASSSSAEDQRIIVDFPVSQISSDRADGSIPASGSVNFFLRLYNAKHSQTVPRDFDLVVSAIKDSWEEGTGLDMEDYTDLTYDQTGSNWVMRAGDTAWSSQGGDYYVDASSSFTASFVSGVEDMELNITPLVEQWVNSAGNVLGSKSNNGVLVKLRSNAEDAVVSYYTKKFFSRTSQFFFKRPLIEARWDSSTKDDRGNFHFSSSVAPAEDNLNTLYLYNVINGRLRDIPSIGTGAIYLSIYSGSATNTAPAGSKLKLSAGGDVAGAGDTSAVGGYVSTGIYSASFAFTGATDLTKVFDVWHNNAGVEFSTGSVATKTFGSAQFTPSPEDVVSVTNLKEVYNKSENNARLRVFTRNWDWSPTIYTVASQAANGLTVPDMYWRIFRIVDGLEIIPYATGSAAPEALGTATSYTRLSYDSEGSYFDLDMRMLEQGYAYGLQFMRYYNEGYVEQPEIFKFRVE